MAAVQEHHACGRNTSRSGCKGQNVGGEPRDGYKWNALVQHVQTIWDKGKIPIQLRWVITASSQKVVGIIVASASSSQSGRSSKG